MARIIHLRFRPLPEMRHQVVPEVMSPSADPPARLDGMLRSPSPGALCVVHGRMYAIVMSTLSLSQVRAAMAGEVNSMKAR